MARDAMLKFANVLQYNKGKPTPAFTEIVTQNNGYACPVDRMKPSVSVVISNCNCKKYTSTCLKILVA